MRGVPANRATTAPAARNGPNGIAVLPSPLRAATTMTPDHRAPDEADEERRDHGGAQVDPHAERQLHVSEPHPLDVAHAVVDLADQEQEACSTGSGHEPLPPRPVAEQDHERDPGSRHREDDDIGDDADLQVDLTHENERRDEEQMRDQEPAEPVQQDDPDEQQGGERLTERIPPADGSAAVPAAPAKHEPAEHRDVVVGADLVAAVRAVRAAPADALVVSQPPRPRVQEAADEQSVHGRDDDEQRRHDRTPAESQLAPWEEVREERLEVGLGHRVRRAAPSPSCVASRPAGSALRDPLNGLLASVLVARQVCLSPQQDRLLALPALGQEARRQHEADRTDFRGSAAAFRYQSAATLSLADPFSPYV